MKAALLVILFAALVTATHIQTTSRVCGPTTWTVEVDVPAGGFQSIEIEELDSSTNPVISPAAFVNITNYGSEVQTVVQQFNVSCDLGEIFHYQILVNSVPVYFNHTLCLGLITVPFIPSSVVRGQEFNATVELVPPPNQITGPVDIYVRENNPLVIPGNDRINFGIDQDVSQGQFYTQKLFFVGDTQLSFQSRSFRDYGGPQCDPLLIDVEVLGTITSTLAGQTIGDGVKTPVTVTIDPPAPELEQYDDDETDNFVTVSVDATGVGEAVSIPRGDIPEDIIYQHGQSEGDFTLKPTSGALGSQSITYSALHYQTTVETFTVAGSIFTDTPPFVTTRFPTLVSVSILPHATSGSVQVSITTSPNLQAPASLSFVSTGESLLEFSLIALSEGQGTITFSADGYVDTVDVVTISDVICQADETFTLDGFSCATCPPFFGDPCSDEGVCTFSLFRDDLARCVCNDGFEGSGCQFALDDPNVESFPFDESGGAFTAVNIPGLVSFSLNLPFGFFYDGNPVDGGKGTIFIDGYFPDDPFGNAVDPIGNPPLVDGGEDRVDVLVSGFDVDLLVFDNTPLPNDEIVAPFVFTANFDGNVYSQMQVDEAALYYWNGSEWIPATMTCVNAGISVSPPSTNIQTLTQTVSACALGQYHYFQVGPQYAHAETSVEAPDDEDLVPLDDDDTNRGNAEAAVDTTTGITGIQAQVPPQPTFYKNGPVSVSQAQALSSAEPSILNISVVLLVVLLATVFVL